MNRHILALLMFAGISAMAQTTPAKKATAKPAAKKIPVSCVVKGKVEQTLSYCGGAAPSKEVLDDLATPVPVAGKKFYIRQGNINTTSAKIVASFVTDENGAFTVTVPPGNYSIIFEEQLNTIDARDYQTANTSVDEKCLKEWWAKPLQLLKAKGKTTNVKILLHQRCFINNYIPCVQYTGPKPP